MADFFVKREFHYEAIANTPENADRIRELTNFDPVMMPAEWIIPFCYETQKPEQICADQEEFDQRYVADGGPGPIVREFPPSSL